LELDKLISKKDSLMMLEIIHKSLSCETEDDFLNLMEQFKNLVFFECSNCSWTDVQNILNGEKITHYSINDHYPVEFLKIYLDNGYHTKDHVIQNFYKTFKIQSFVEIDHNYKEDFENPVLELSYEFGLDQGYAYGVRGFEFNSATAFFLAGRHVENDQRSREIIKHLVPHLSIAMKRLLPFTVDSQLMKLTSSELEVLKWLKEGKTTWETSLILNKSERVVKFHIDNILRKLNAMNRTHAVAIALENNLIRI
jgi:LuxR family transcriptional regulator, quorum-sensing system regulator CviR